MHKIRNVINIVLFAIITLLFVNCGARFKHLKRFEGFQSKPKFVEVKTFKILDDDISLKSKKLSYKQTYLYDKEGRLIVNNDFNSEEKPTLNWHYDYDDYGNVIGLKTKGNDGEFHYWSNDTYDSKGRLQTSKRRGDFRKFYYHELNNLTEIRGNHLDGRFKELSKIKHDDKGRRTEISAFKENGDTKAIIKYAYDEDDNEVEFKWYNSSKKLTKFLKKEHDKYGNITKSWDYKITETDTVLTCYTKRVYSYDLKGNVVNEISYINGKPKTLKTQNIIYHD